MLFDVIILDLLDTEELPQGQAWAEYLYSDLFFERIACAISDNGVLVSNFGEAPESPFEPLKPDYAYPIRVNTTRGPMFERKIRQLQSMSRQFVDFRVYDTFIPAFRGIWAFAIGMVPRVTPASDVSRVGISHFEGTPIMVDYRLHHGTFPKAIMEHYHGRIQRGFQQPRGDWGGAYCDMLDVEVKAFCNATMEHSFLQDEKRSWKVDKLDDESSTCVMALENLRKGIILGAWDELVPEKERISTFLTRSCDYFNVARFEDVHPLIKAKEWNPRLDNIRSETTHSVILLQDITAGDVLIIKGEKC
jgi:hypothetical protein